MPTLTTVEEVLKVVHAKSATEITVKAGATYPSDAAANPPPKIGDVHDTYEATGPGGTASVSIELGRQLVDAGAKATRP